MLQTWIKDLNSPDWWTRIEAENAIRDAGAHDSSVIDALANLLVDAAQANEPRWRAAHALGVLRAKAAIPALASVLRDPSSDVQYYAAWSLGKIGDPAGFEALKSVLHSTTVEEQANFAAAIALVQIDRERGLQALHAALTDENEAARRVARGALATING